MLTTMRDSLAVIRETIIVLAVSLILLFPSQVGAWLWMRGVQTIQFGGATVSLKQFQQTRRLLNTVTDAAKVVDQPPQVQASLESAAGQLSRTLADQVRSISQQDPDALPREGWIYLGTINGEKTGWRDASTPDVREKWPLKPDDEVTLSTDTNLRADSASNERPKARIISVLPDGTKVRILELDTARGDKAAGYRAWARVEVVA